MFEFHLPNQDSWETCRLKLDCDDIYIVYSRAANASLEILFTKVLLLLLMIRTLIGKFRGLSSLPDPTSSHLLVEPGQILHNQYRIIRSLGVGQQATVWLAEKLSSYAHLL